MNITRTFALFIATASLLVAAPKEELPSARVFASEQEAQAALLKRFPELAKSDSAFNKAFVERVANDRKAFPKAFDNPSWLWILAHQVNADLTTNPKEVLWEQRGPFLYGPEGARVPKGVDITFTNFSQKRTIAYRVKVTFEDGTTEEKDASNGPSGMDIYGYRAFQKPVRDAVIVSAQFK